jgi:2-oxoglutarate ferredoxin oxidoreductase subunit delta
MNPKQGNSRKMTTESRQEGPADPVAAEVTTPPEKEEAKERKQFDINVYRDWCKGCGICAALCPKQVLSRNEEGGPVVADPDACIGCGWCELHCPDFAISVRPRREPDKPEATTGK